MKSQVRPHAETPDDLKKRLRVNTDIADLYLKEDFAIHRMASQLKNNFGYCIIASILMFHEKEIKLNY